MPVWRFSPAAAADDANWLNGPVWAELLVRAGTTGQARWLASNWEAGLLDHSPTEGAAGNLAMDYQSALADPKLYRVVEMAVADGSAHGPPAVLVSRRGRRRPSGLSAPR